MLPPGTSVKLNYSRVYFLLLLLPSLFVLYFLANCIASNCIDGVN